MIDFFTCKGRLHPKKNYADLKVQIFPFLHTIALRQSFALVCTYVFISSWSLSTEKNSSTWGSEKWSRWMSMSPWLCILIWNAGSSTPEASLFTHSGMHISAGGKKESGSNAGYPVVQPGSPVFKLTSLDDWLKETRNNADFSRTTTILHCAELTPGQLRDG